jgi:hypothetical protein
VSTSAPACAKAMVKARAAIEDRRQVDLRALGSLDAFV